MLPLLRLAWRESRTARRTLLLYMSSIALGVAALVAIDSFAANATRAVQDQSRAILGGDVTFRSRADYTPAALAFFDSLRTAGLPVEQVTTFASMATLPRTTATRLTQVRAVTAGFPLYGEVVTKPAEAWGTLRAGRHALVDPGVLVALGAQVGDSLRLGYATFLVTGTITQIPGDPGIAAAVGPRVFIAEQWLEATGLLTFGSRAEYETMLKLPASTAPGRWLAPLRPQLREAELRPRTVTDREEDFTDGIAELAKFIGIVGLVALLLGGIGVASGVHAFVQRKIDTVAILRCLGATGAQVLTVYALQAAVMGLVGATGGALLGVAIQAALPNVLGDFLPVDVAVRLEPVAILRGILLGVWVALVFALRPLLALRRISPLVTLRRDLASLAAARRHDPATRAVDLLLVASVLLLALLRADTLQEGAWFAAGIGAALLLLGGSAALLVAVARRWSRGPWPYVVRQGLANLHRPANQTQSVVIALGFGAFLVSTLVLVQANLLQQFDVTLGTARGNLVFFDVQDDQRAGLDSLVRAAGADVLDVVPIVTMRVDSLRGRSVVDHAREVGLAPTHWAFRREYRSTHRDTLVATERMVAGAWTDGAPLPDGSYPLSLELDVADNLRVGLGDAITWDVQGVPVRTTVTSLREVTWGRFEPNFFAVFPTAALAGAPQTHVLLAGVQGDSAVAALQRAAVARYPNASSIDLSLVQGTVARVVERVASAVRFLALFAFAMGVPVLFSAVAATRRDRLREGVLLKALGASRAQVGRILLSEYAALGVLGALAGMVLSFGGAWALLRFVFDLPVTIPALSAAGIASLMALLAVVIGALTGREVFRATAMEALRE
jgi:putative ABC transport system permease protein